MELEGLNLLADTALSHESLSHRNCEEYQEHAFVYKLKDLNMLADVASSITTAAAVPLLNHNKKKKTNKDQPTSRSSLSNPWYLQVHENSNLKLRFSKIGKTTLDSTETSSNPSFSCQPLHLLSQVAFAHKPSTLWALCPHTIPTRRRSTSKTKRRGFKKIINKTTPVSSSSTQTSSNPSLSSHPIDLLPHVAFPCGTSILKAFSANTIPTKKRSTYNRRPNWGFKPVPTTPIAGSKRSFAKIDTSRVENKRRRVTPAVLPIQLNNYLATKKVVSDPHLVIMKQLSDTDLNPLEACFSIPVNQVIDRDFISPEERKTLDNHEAIDVTLIQPCLEEKPMHLKKSMMNGAGIYVLNKGWKSVIENKKNSLLRKPTVEVWSLTCNGVLHFALCVSDGIHNTPCAGSKRKGKSEDEEPTSDDESTVTFHEDV